MGQYAEMIFVAGPQKGQRATLVGKGLFAGRSSDCDIQIQEEYASRRHLGLALTSDGWLVENLSNNPIWVNGKKFKTGKRILLDTGDVVRLALETQLLFVAVGDDSEAALAQWREAHGESAPAPQSGEAPVSAASSAASAPAGAPATARATAAQPRSVDGKDKPVEKPSEKPAEDKTPLTQEEKDALARKTKVRRYILLACIWAGVMVGLVAGLKSCPREDGGDDRGSFIAIGREKIREIIDAPFEPRTANPHTSVRYEEKARAMFKVRHDAPGNLYECVKLFKLSLAYRNNLPPTPVVAEEFRRAKQELIDEVGNRYEDGYVNFRNKNWPRAKENFEALLRLYPVKNEPEPEASNPIWESTIRYLTYVGAQLNKSSRR